MTLNISDASSEALTTRAIDPAEALASGLVSTVASRDDMPDAFSPGHYAGPGILLVWKDADGTNVTHQYRPDQSKRDADGRPMKYVFPKGAPYGFGWVQVPASLKAPVLVAEGLLKAVAASQALGGAHAVGAVPGCRLRKEGTDYSWAAGRSVVVALDADLATNREVWEGALTLREELLAADAEDVRFLAVPGDGKDGLDDALARLDAAERRTALLSWIEAAGPLCTAPLPKDIRLVPSSKVPSLVAEELLGDFQDEHGNATLINRDGVWHQYTGRNWSERTEGEVYDLLQRILVGCWHQVMKDGKPVLDDFGRPKVRAWNPTTSTVNEVQRALRTLTNVSFQVGHDVVDGIWLAGTDASPDHATGPVMAFRNGLVPVNGDRALSSHTPLWFSQACVPYDYNPAAPKPAEWLAFLDNLPDQGSRDALQEFFGYLLSGRTDLHSYLQLNGPKRSGKGVILKVAEALVGSDNAEGLALADLSKNFGLERLVGKTLATVGDARLSRNGQFELLERLLTITAADRVQVDRKYRKQWSGVLAARLIIATNDPLTLPDESGALAVRTLLIRTTKSFAGKEDRSLTGRLLDELPGILLWALEGLDRLNANGGRFSKPGAAAALEETLRRAASPLSAFLDDWCALEADETTTKDDLYGAYAAWAKSEGHEFVMTAAKFATGLYSTGSGIEQARPRIEGKRVQVFTGVRLRAVKKPGGEWSAPDEQPAEDVPSEPLTDAEADAFEAIATVATAGQPVDPYFPSDVSNPWL